MAFCSKNSSEFILMLSLKRRGIYSYILMINYILAILEINRRMFNNCTIYLVIKITIK